MTKSKTISSISCWQPAIQRLMVWVILRALIEFGGSPRASIALTRAAKAHAFLRHRGYVTPEDVKAIGMDVLRHRVLVTYEAEAEEIDAEEIARQIFDHVEVP